MISLSKHLYIVDEIKWSFIDAVLNKRIKEAIFWITEYYESGFIDETWQVLWVVYDCFYFIKNFSYQKRIDENYKKWTKDKNFYHILGVVYWFYKMKNFDFEIFNIVNSNLKYKKITISVDNDLYSKIGISKNNLYGLLLMSLVKKKYKNIWFFIQFNFENSLNIICKFYDHEIITFKNEDYNDKKLQLLMFVYEKNHIYKKKIYFKIKVKKEYREYYQELIKTEINPVYKTLKEMRHFSISKDIGCFNLKRYNLTREELLDLYFYKWEYYASFSPVWKKIFDSWGIDFYSNKNPQFLNDDVLEIFYCKFGLEPDEQSCETHNKSIGVLYSYPINDWIKNIKN